MSTLVLPDEMPLSVKEQAQWMLHRLVPDRGICNVSLAFRVERQLRWWPLQQALDHLLRRHPALRAVPYVTGGVARKRFLAADVGCPLTTEAATEETLGDVLSELTARPFRFDGGPLARAYLVSLPGGSVICLVTHHLVADNTSANVLREELAQLYDGYAQRREPPSELAGTAPIYVEPGADPTAVDFWLRQLDGVDPSALALPGSRPPATRPSFAGGRIDRFLPAESREAVVSVQRRVSVTANMVMLTAFYLLLARHGAGPDLVVGVPVDGRRNAPTGDVVGFHTNTLPLRIAVDEQETVADLLKRVCWALLTGIGHDSGSFEVVQAQLARRSGDWRAPVFRHMFNYLPVAGEPLVMAGEPVETYEIHNHTARLDLEWRVFPKPDSTEIKVVYSTEVHDRSYVERMLDRYDVVLRELAEKLDRPVADVTARAPADDVALRRLRGPVRAPGRPVLTAVREHTVRAPDAPAVRVDGRDVRYADLVAGAEAVRRALTQRQVRPGEPVALVASRGPALAAAVLGVWAAGAAYLPLDPRHPASRLADQLDDAGARLVLADAPPDPAWWDGPWLPLPAPDPGRAGADPPDWPVPDPGSPAYLIYTSGSTGRPKGVVVSHANLANLVWDFAARLGVGPTDRTLWLTTFSFDISALELLLPLASGGTVVTASDDDRLDPRRLLDQLERDGVTVVQATPTTWRHLAGHLAGHLRGRQVLSGGEPLPASLAERLRADGCRLFNVYGPTETTIWSTVAELVGPVDDPVPLGEPVANTDLHVLDRCGRPVLPGMPGELWVAGAGVALGYHDRPDLTAERFPDRPGAGRCYRTGDLVRWDGDRLAFLGRADRQVKVRGHRLELSEIEAVLERHPAVRAVAVVTEPDSGGDTRLVAAVQPYGEPVPVEELRSLAAGYLPEAAVPNRYVSLPDLPSTGNGKVDHRRLRELLATSGAPARLPDDPVRAALTTLWREVLADERLDVHANFFLHGGHSLLAVALAERIADRFDRPVGFEAVFDAPTPDRFAAWLADQPDRPGGPT